MILVDNSYPTLKPIANGTIKNQFQNCALKRINFEACLSTADKQIIDKMYQCAEINNIPNDQIKLIAQGYAMDKWLSKKSDNDIEFDISYLQRQIKESDINGTRAAVQYDKAILNELMLHFNQVGG